MCNRSLWLACSHIFQYNLQSEAQDEAVLPDDSGMMQLYNMMILWLDVFREYLIYLYRKRQRM